jgi:hypothetical protein
MSESIGLSIGGKTYELREVEPKPKSEYMRGNVFLSRGDLWVLTYCGGDMKPRLLCLTGGFRGALSEDSYATTERGSYLSSSHIKALFGSCPWEYYAADPTAAFARYFAEQAVS